MINRKKLAEYGIWKSMRERCNNQRCKAYYRYGGRGIKVDPSWDDFWRFYSDMGPRPPGRQMDRIDNNKGYSRENCRWVTPSINNSNKRSPRKGMLRGVHIKRGRYIASIRISGITHHIGCFSTEEEAHKAYLKISIEWWGPRSIV